MQNTTATDATCINSPMRIGWKWTSVLFPALWALDCPWEWPKPSWSETGIPSDCSKKDGAAPLIRQASHGRARRANPSDPDQANFIET